MVGVSNWRPTAICPHCEAVLSGHMVPDGESTPQEGDFSVCIYCAKASRWMLGKLVTFEMRALVPEERREVEAAQAIVRALQGKN